MSSEFEGKALSMLGVHELYVAAQCVPDSFQRGRFFVQAEMPQRCLFENGNATLSCSAIIIEKADTDDGAKNAILRPLHR